MNIKTIFNTLSNDLIEEIMIRDAFLCYVEDKMTVIKNSNKYEISEKSTHKKKENLRI